MDIPFSLRGLDGRVTVTYDRNVHPELRGSGPQAAGYPFCHATVAYPADGYDAVLGWIQLVRSDDNISQGREFEIDPLDFLGEVSHPFCWIGLRPELFDAPSRSPRVDMDWAAHSFLCVPDGRDDGGMEVQALLGFRWGFRVRAGEITLELPTLLSPLDWDADAAVLEPRYPAWHFLTGFRSG